MLQGIYMLCSVHSTRYDVSSLAVPPPRAEVEADTQKPEARVM